MCKQTAIVTDTNSGLRPEEAVGLRIGIARDILTEAEKK